MTEPIDPLRPVHSERRKTARRRADPPPPPQVDGERANLPVAAAKEDPKPNPEPEARPEPQPRKNGQAIFAAQLMGQEGQKRGLRGGPPVLNEARSTYLGTEYSGSLDRRPRRGAITKTDI